MKFIDILRQYNIETNEDHHHARSGWVQFDCPFCGKGTHGYHMGYSIDSNYVNCWRCGSHRLPKTLLALTGLKYSQIKDIIDNLTTQEITPVLIIGKLNIPRRITKLQPPHIKYLKQRGFYHKQLIKFWDIQGIGIASELSWRIYIPILHKGHVVSWITRSIGNATSKYIGADKKDESIPRKSLLYGADYARHAIIICEGPFDVWRIGPGAVATLGTGVSTAQIRCMIKYPIRAIVFDNEKEAQARAQKLCQSLSLFPGDTYNITIDANDPAEASTKEIKRIRKLLK